MIRLFIEKHNAVFIACVLIVVLGVLAYIRLPRESTPEIKQPWIFVTTAYPGVSAKDIESLVTIPIEEQIDGLEGLSRISSSSAQNVSSISVEFTADTDVETALRRVKERVDVAKAELPDEVGEPQVRELNSSDWPIFIVALSHPEGSVVIDQAARDLRDRLKRIPGVLSVGLAGNQSKEVAVELDPIKLRHYGLSLDEVAGAIRSENLSIPGGTLKNQAKYYSLAVTGQIVDPRQFQDIVIRSGPVKIRLAELGTVAFRTAEPETYSRLNGQPTISLEVKKRTGQNLIKIVEAAKKEIEAVRPTLPAGTLITYSYDDSRYIKDMIADLENNMFSGFLLVLAVTLLFLGLRNSFFVSLAIPFSMLISFFVLQLLGVTLNMIVLFSLIMAVGMLVDNGIVIVENIFRHASMGKSRQQAAIDGSSEVAGPIISSAITTVVAFFPIIFMPGIMGQFMKYLPITVIVVLSASLLVALTINPVFCAQFMGISGKAQRKILEGSAAFVGFQKWYERRLSWVLKRPGLAIAAIVTVVVAGFVLYALIGREPIFFPSLDPSTAVINLEVRQGTPLEETDRYVRRIESLIPTVPASVEYVQVTTGAGSDGFGGGQEEYHKATVRVEFKPYLQREIKGAQATENLKAALTDLPGAEVSFEELGMGPPAGHPVSYQITGRDYEVMGGIAERILEILEGYPELKLINSDYEPARPEVSVEIDRQKAAYHGLSTAQIAAAIRNSMTGTTVGSFRQEAEEYDIVVRYQREYRDSLNELASLQVTAENGERIPIQAVAQIRHRSAVGVIKRADLRRAIEVWADFKPEVQNKTEVKAGIARKIAGLQLPAGYEVGTGQGGQIQQESANFLVLAFVIALFLIFLVLILQFNSFADPFIIMASVFLSLGGVLWGYALTGMAFVVIMSGIGCIALAGVAVNNCIVLVDYTNVLLRQGVPWREAVVQAGKVRLRPVLLTAITTVLGLVPMALGVSFDVHSFTVQVGSEQSEFWKAFAWAMIFGLSFATVSTLVIVPALLTLKFRLNDWRAQRRGKSEGGSASGSTGGNGRGKLKAEELTAAAQTAVAGIPSRPFFVS
jgi:multidrug efflux pump